MTSREYAVGGTPEAPTMEPVAGSGVGLLENPNFHFLRTGTTLVETTPEQLAFLASPEPMLVSKANVRSRVHRRSHMDYIGIKLFNAKGAVSGEVRILGLFTSASAAIAKSKMWSSSGCRPAWASNRPRGRPPPANAAFARGFARFLKAHSYPFRRVYPLTASKL